MTATEATSSTSWIGRTNNGQRVVANVGDGSGSGADSVYDGGSYDRHKNEPKQFKPAREYDGDSSNGSELWKSDIEKHVPPHRRRQFKRLQYWQHGTNPSYQDGTARDTVVKPQDSDGRNALRDKLETVERISDELGIGGALRNEARKLAASVNGKGHGREKIAVGALAVAQEAHIANRMEGANVEGDAQNVTEALQGDLTKRERHTALNLLEEVSDIQIFERRFRNRGDVSNICSEFDFSLSNAKGVYYG